MAEAAPLDELTEAVLYAESRGRRFDAKGKLLEGPKTRHGTAKGEMQVLDKTMRNPGYGVVGARDNSPDERARVGREYLAALNKKYGDQTAALAAYNWGPGNTNKWLEKGAKFEDLPTETQNYITGIQARMAQRRAAVAPATPAEATVASAPARMNPNLQAQGQKAAAARAAATPKPAAASPQDLLSSASQYGPDYQAALALAALGDEDDDEEYTTKSGEPLVRARSMLDEMTAEPAPKTALADLNLKVASPFAALQPKGGGPVRLAMGGVVEPITPAGFEVQSPFANSANPTVANMAGNVPRGTMPGATPVFRAEGSPESGETPARSTLESLKEQTKAFGKGVADLPYTIIGAPVDIATFIGRNVPGVSKVLPGINQEQVGSSEYLKHLMERAGLREAAPTQPNLKAAYEAGSMLSSFASPTGVVLGARRMISKAGEAAKALREMPAEEVAAVLPAPAPVPTPAPARVRAPVAPVEEPRPAPQPPVQQELPLPVPEPTPVPAPAPAPVAAAAPTESRQLLQAMPEVTPPVTPPVTPAAPAAPAVPKWDELMLHEKAERPFVSKLEMYVDQMQGKTTPEQFLSGLKGKFRDHEIARAQEALADVAPGTKLTGQDIGARLADLYSPRGWKTEIGEPKVGQYYSGHDNPFPGEPIGTINLLERVPADTVEMSKMLGGTQISASHLLMEPLRERSLSSIESILQSPYGKDIPEGKKLLQNLKETLKSYEQDPDIQLVHTLRAVKYPILSPEFKVVEARLREERKGQGFEAKIAITQDAMREVAQNAMQKLNQEFHMEVPFVPGTLNDQPAAVQRLLENLVEGRARPVMATYADKLNQTIKPITKLQEKYLPYRGQHSSIAWDNPIGFSRFVEIPAVIPGQGQTQALHVLELQSDRLDDLRKLGRRGSSVEKDRELINKYDAEIDKILQPYGRGSNERTYLEDLRTNMLQELMVGHKSGEGRTPMDRVLEEIDALPPQLQDAAQKMLKEVKAQIPAKRRVTKEETPYSIYEPFAGMEHKPQELQQLLIKNAINGAIERGLNMVSFPYVESKESQLYRNIPNNLRQVIKDLGGEKSGLELLMVEHKDGLTGKTYNSPAIRWGDETADRLRQTGIPFKKGGLVERKMDDNRTYV